MKIGHPFWQVLSKEQRCIALWILLICISLPALGGLIQPVSIVNTVNTPAVTPSGGSGDSMAPIISSNGRYVLFASSANNLTLNDSANPTPPPVPAVMNIYLRDRLQQRPPSWSVLAWTAMTRAMVIPFLPEFPATVNMRSLKVRQTTWLLTTPMASMMFLFAIS